MKTGWRKLAAGAAVLALHALLALALIRWQFAPAAETPAREITLLLLPAPRPKAEHASAGAATPRDTVPSFMFVPPPSRNAIAGADGGPCAAWAHRSAAARRTTTGSRRKRARPAAGDPGPTTARGAKPRR
ncbi:MAG TPA: hypothetical protein VMH86_05345 [Rhizomicrobium sp.]|nr:hypothetical protein [Rhizomicrobium sp.]